MKIKRRKLEIQKYNWGNPRITSNTRFSKELMEKLEETKERFNISKGLIINSALEEFFCIDSNSDSKSNSKNGKRR